MSDTPLEHRSDRDILIVTAYAVKDLTEKWPKLEGRVDSLEADRDRLEGRTTALKGLSYIGGGGGIAGALSAIWHYLSHGPK